MVPSRLYQDGTGIKSLSSFTGAKYRYNRYKEGTIIYALRCGNNHLEVFEGLGLIMLRRHLNSTAGETVGITDKK